MDIVIAIIAVLVAIAFWQKIIHGIVGGLILGFIGSFFGGNGAKIGFVIGFILGISAKNESEKKQEEENKVGKESFKSSKEKTGGAPESRIVRCPSCKKKIRVHLPLQGTKGKCAACSNSFSIKLDEHGNLKVDKETAENVSQSGRGYETVSYYFQVLDVEPTATPDEVRAAYKKKIREYHPDRVSGLGEKLKKMADDESKAINKAYSALKSKGLAS